MDLADRPVRYALARGGLAGTVFLAAAILEVLDQLVVGPVRGTEWLAQLLFAFTGGDPSPDQPRWCVAAAAGRAVRLSPPVLAGVLLCLGTAIYLRYAIYGASECCCPARLRNAVVVMPTVLIAVLGAYSLGATIRLITAVRQARNGDDDDRP